MVGSNSRRQIINILDQLNRLRITFKEAMRRRMKDLELKIEHLRPMWVCGFIIKVISVVMMVGIKSRRHNLSVYD